jgi:hypothetical protein
VSEIDKHAPVTVTITPEDLAVPAVERVEKYYREATARLQAHNERMKNMTDEEWRQWLTGILP